MGRATVYCDKCGEMIVPKDVDAGKAVFFQEVYFCSRCKKQIEHLLEKAPPPAQQRAPSGVRRKTPSGGAQPAVRPRAARSKSSRSSGLLPSVQPRKSASSGLHRAVRPGQAAGARAPSRSMPGGASAERAADEGRRYVRGGAHVQRSGPNPKLLLGIGGGLLALIVLILVLAAGAGGGGDDDGSNGTPGAYAEAERLFNDFQTRAESATPSDLSILLSEAERLELELRGTPYFDHLQRLEAELEHRQELAQLRARLDTIRIRPLNDEFEAEKKAEALKKLRSAAVSRGAPAELIEKIEAAIADVARDEGVRVATEVARELQSVEFYAEDYPEELDEIRTRYEQLLTRYERYEGDAAYESVETQLELVRVRLEELELTVRQEAEDAYRELDRELSRLRASREYKDAVDRCDEYLETYGELPIGDRVRRLRDQLLEEWDKAESEAWDDLGDDEQDDSGDEEEAVTPGEARTLFDGTDLSAFDTRIGGPGAWSVEGGHIVGKHPDENPPDVGAQGNVSFSHMIYPKGSESWREYVYRFELKIERGEFGLFVKLAPPSSFAWGSRMGAMNGFREGPWFRMQLTVTEEEIQLDVNGNVQTHKPKSDAPQTGPPVIALTTGSWIHLRNIEVELKE